MKRFVILFLPLLAFSMCTSKTRHQDLIDITEDLNPSSGFIDLSFKIVERTETDTTYNYLAEGLYRNDTVGLIISLKKGIQAENHPKSSESQPSIISNGVSFQSIGEKSDQLLAVMSELYGINTAFSSFRKETISFLCVNTNNLYIDYEKGKYIFKILLENKYLCSEMYVNFDFYNNEIHLNEKDVEFRKNILTFFFDNRHSKLANRGNSTETEAN